MKTHATLLGLAAAATLVLPAQAASNGAVGGKATGLRAALDHVKVAGR
jgi:hypothetical protein